MLLTGPLFLLEVAIPKKLCKICTSGEGGESFRMPGSLGRLGVVSVVRTGEKIRQVYLLSSCKKFNESSIFNSNNFPLILLEFLIPKNLCKICASGEGG